MNAPTFGLTWRRFDAPLLGAWHHHDCWSGPADGMNSSFSFRTFTRVLVALAVAWAGQASSQAIREFTPQTVESLGRAIYEQDLVARSATDILRAGNKAREVPESEHVVATQEISNAPIETHVFLGSLHQIDIGVLVAGMKTLWIFANGKMASIKKLE